MNKISLGLLEFGKGLDQTVTFTVDDVIEYAVLADKLGYSRFWLTEHHTFSPTAYWNSPEMFLPVLAGLTENIKIGQAGVLLGVHSPYRVALNFKLLANLFPGRVDLGVARGTPDNEITLRWLDPSYETHSQYFFDKLKVLIKCFQNEPELLESKICIPPYGGTSPSLWYLARSNAGMDMALKNNLNYSRSLFHPGASKNYEKELLLDYQERFEQNHKHRPSVNIAVPIICTDASNDSRTARNAKYYDNLSGNFESIIVGCPNKIHDSLLSFQEAFGVDEFILLDLSPTNSDRIGNLELLSNKFELQNEY